MSVGVNSFGYCLGDIAWWSSILWFKHGLFSLPWVNSNNLYLAFGPQKTMRLKPSENVKSQLPVAKA